MSNPEESSVAPRAVRAVVFDWYATLGYPFEDGWWNQLRSLIARGGGTPDEAAMLEWEKVPTDHVAYSGSRPEYDAWTAGRFRRLLRACAVPPDRLDALVAESDALRAAEHVGLLDGARDVVDTLHRAGLLVAVCSNWDWDLDRHLERNGIADRFDLVVCSAIAGYRKPHAAIFELVAAGLGVEPGEVLFVGDDLLADIDGATEAGMRPVHAAWAISCTADHPDHVVCCSSFAELLALPELAGPLGSGSAER